MLGGIASGKLTDKAIKAFVAKAEKGRRLFDGGGPYLFHYTGWQSTWSIKYRLDGALRTSRHRARRCARYEPLKIHCRVSGPPSNEPEISRYPG